MKESITFLKSKAFALEIINLYKKLVLEKEFVLSRQILRSGTSIGANLAEAQMAQTVPDFYTKLFISKKEALETLYWLDLLYQSNYIAKETFTTLNEKCNELIRLLIASTKHYRRK